jgi:hypothetical protein
MTGPAVVPLHYRSTKLVPLGPHHLGWLRDAELQGPVAFRWRHHGAHPEPHSFEAVTLSCLAAFVVTSRNEPCGIVTAYDHDHANQHCKVAAARLGGGAGLATIRGTLLLIDYLFHGWPFRKLYFETPEYNLRQFASRDHLPLREEGRLVEHVFLGSRFHDLVILSLYRDDWLEQRSRWIATEC